MRERNIGVDILRIIACYMVVSIHFGWRLPCADFAVPCFFALAFVYFDPKMSLRNFERRMLRLYVPFLFWGLIGFIARSLRDGSIGERLWVQLVFGQTCNSPLWFVSVLIFVTIVLVMLRMIVAKWYCMSVVGGAIVSFFLEYCGINYAVSNQLPRSMAMTVGRIVEMLPYAALGYIVKQMANFEHENARAFLIGLCLSAIGMVCNVLGVEYPYQGFGYGGFIRFVSVSGIVVMAYCASPWLSHLPNRVKKLIYEGAGLTAGVYFMHRLTGEAITLTHICDNDGALLTFFVVIFSCFVVKLMRFLGLGIVVK